MLNTFERLENRKNDRQLSSEGVWFLFGPKQPLASCRPAHIEPTRQLTFCVQQKQNNHIVKCQMHAARVIFTYRKRRREIDARDMCLMHEASQKCPLICTSPTLGGDDRFCGDPGGAYIDTDKIRQFKPLKINTNDGEESADKSKNKSLKRGECIDERWKQTDWGISVFHLS